MVTISLLIGMIGAWLFLPPSAHPWLSICGCLVALGMGLWLDGHDPAPPPLG